MTILLIILINDIFLKYKYIMGNVSIFADIVSAINLILILEFI